MIADVRGLSVLVVGGTRGIGLAIAKRFASEGAAVCLTGRDAKAAAAAAASAGAAAGYALDVRDRAAIAAVVERFVDDRGTPDALVYSAGISPVFTSAEKLDAAVWDDVLAVNLSGAFAAAQAFARVAIAAGRPASIVFIASVAGITGAGRLAAYASSKAGMIGLTKSLAWDWARHRIRVNAIAPGYVETEMSAGLAAHPTLSQFILSRTPQGRMAQPDEIADMAVFLVSKSASFATGSVVTIDGGWTAG